LQRHGGSGRSATSAFVTHRVGVKETRHGDRRRLSAALSRLAVDLSTFTPVPWNPAHGVGAITAGGAARATACGFYRATCLTIAGGSAIARGASGIMGRSGDADTTRASFGRLASAALACGLVGKAALIVDARSRKQQAEHAGRQ
jgi:hypothetical protein